MIQRRLRESTEKCFSTLEVSLGYSCSLEITLSHFSTAACDSLGWNKLGEAEGQKRRIEGRPKNTIKLWNQCHVFFKQGVIFPFS